MTRLWEVVNKSTGTTSSGVSFAAVLATAIANQDAPTDVLIGHSMPDDPNFRQLMDEYERGPNCDICT
jgi:hypothetical protein